ncbi:hypothetical protein RhiirC2_653323, partial [Rhizophagus irregularis]
RHIRRHTGDQPFQCNQTGCQRKFSDSSELRIHIRTHTGKRPYKCHESGCEKSFTRVGDLKRHNKFILVKNLLFVQ